MALKKASVSTIDEDALLVDHETWSAILEPSLCQDSAAVECLARLLFTIKKEIDSGSEGVEQASRTLLAGIEFIYPYTEAHRAARRLYLLSLTGRLKPQDEPLQLLNNAIERGGIAGEPEKKRAWKKEPPLRVVS